MFYIHTHAPSIADQISEPEALVKAVPRFGPRFDAIQEMRQAAEEDFAHGSPLGGDDPNIRRIASIPPTLFGVLTDPTSPSYIPYFTESSKVFHAWLKRHPEYATYRRR